MDEKELQALYNAMSKQFDVGDWNSFKGKMQTTDQRKNFYDAINKNGYDLGDYNEFEGRIAGTVKKKGGVSEALSIGSSEGAKKPSLSAIGEIGGRAGTSNGSSPQSEKQRLTDFIYNLKTPEQKAQSKPTTKPIVASSKPFKKDEKPFDQTREEYVETATNKLNDIMYGEGDEWKDPIGSSVKGIKKSESVKDALGYHGAMNLTESSLMSDGFEANRVLNSTLLGQAGNDNMTANVLKKKATEYNNATKAFNNIQDLNFLDWAKRDEFYNAAMQFYAEKNPHFKAQAEVAGLPTVENNAKRGQIVAQVMNDPDFIAYATKQNPAMMPLIQDVQEKFYQENKDYAANVIANKVSQAMEKGGYNKIDPIFNFAGENAREVADLTAQSELTPEEYQIYKEKNVFDKLDMPSFFEGFATTAKDIGESTKNTFATWFKPMSQSVKESWNKEANHVSAEPKGYTAWFRDVGGVAGLVSTIGMTTGITGGAASATILNFLGQEIENKKAEFPDKPVTAITLGSINTLLYAMLSKDLFPAAKVKSAFTSVQPELKNVVEKFTSGKISQEAARKELQTTFKKVTDFVTGTAAKNTKVSLELAGIQGINRVMDRLAGMDKQRFEELHPDSEIADGIVHTFSTFAPISALGKYGELKNRNRVVEETIYDAVSNPKRTERLINEAEMNLSFGTANEIKANFKVALDAKTELDALKINPKEQKRFIFEALKEKAAKDAMEASSDPVIKKKNSEIVKEAQEIKEKILNGEDADTIVTEKEQKIIDEQKEKEIELQRLEKDHEFELKKFDEDRSKLDGRVPEDKIKIERLEEDKKRAIEDFERKSGKLKPKEEPVELLDQERELDMGDKELTGEGAVIQKAIDENVLKGMDAEMAKAALTAEGGVEQFLSDISDQALDKKPVEGISAEENMKRARKTYGDEIVDLAIEKFPAEAKIEEPTVSEAEGAGSSGVEGKSDVEKQKQLEDKVEEINKKRQSLRGEDGTVPADKMNEWNQLGKELNEAKVSAQRGNSSGSILIKKFEDGADKATSDPVILSEKEKSEASDIIEQVIQGSKTVEEAVKKIARLGYIFDVANANLLTKYISDRLNPDAPKVGNNKSSFQDWVNGKQTEGKSDVVVDKASNVGGDKKEIWMQNIDSYIESELPNTKGSNEIPARRILSDRYEGELGKAIEEGKFQKAIAEGKMSATDAINIIKAAKHEVPKDIQDGIEKVPMSDNELQQIVGRDVFKQIQRSEEQLGEGVVDRNRMIETAKRIQKADKKDKLLPEHIFEALQYETGYPDNWQDLRNAIKKGGIDINSEAIQRQIEVGVDLPKDIVEEFKKSERYKKATPELVKAVEQSLSKQESGGKAPVTKSEGAKNSKGETAQSRAKKVYKDIGEIDEPSDARGLALEYLAGGGKVSESSINEVAGTVQKASLNTGAKEKKSSEVKARDYVSKDGKTIEEVSHSIWDNLPEELRESVTTQELKNELMNVVNTHNTRLEAAIEFRDRYIAKDVRDNLTETEAKELNDTDIARRSKIVEELPENQQNELIDLLAKYENEYGIVDWERLEKDSNGFSPDILSLSNETQKSLDAIIQKNISQATSELNNATDKDGGGKKEKAEERLTTAQSNYNKAAAELKKAEDKISQTQATQSGMFDATQKEMFGVDRTSAKEILDPLRQKVKESKSELDAAQKSVDNINEQPKIDFKEPTKDIKPEQADKVKELEAERDMAILREGKPEVKMEFVTAKELVDSKDPIGNKKIHTDIKDRYKELRNLLDCLWQKK